MTIENSVTVYVGNFKVYKAFPDWKNINLVPGISYQVEQLPDVMVFSRTFWIDDFICTRGFLLSH